MGTWDEPEPTVEDYCGAGGHGYEGDDGPVGRCHCGQRLYPLGGPGREVRVGFRVVDETKGHATVQLWIGRNVGARGNSGQIVIRRDELEELEATGQWDRVPS